MSDIHLFEPLWPEWKIDHLIGRGSFGAVYQAHRENAYTNMVQKAAVKHISIPSATADQEMFGLSKFTAQKMYRGQLDMLVQEIKAMVMLRGKPNIVSYEEHKIVEKPDGAGYDLFLRMELLTGLSNYVQRNGFLTREEVVRLGIDIARALEILQAKKLIHRDIKPGNLFLDEEGNYKLGDFGQARALQTSGLASTRTGTPNYMAPEVYQLNTGYDQTVDIYSLGMVLYLYMNKGFLPFLNDECLDRENALLKRISGHPLPTPCSADAPLAEVILKACAYRPAERYQTATELRQALEKLESPTAHTPANNIVSVECVAEGSNHLLKSSTELCPVGSSCTITAPYMHGYTVVGEQSVSVYTDFQGNTSQYKVRFSYRRDTGDETVIANTAEPIAPVMEEDKAPSFSEYAHTEKQETVTQQREEYKSVSTSSATVNADQDIKVVPQHDAYQEKRAGSKKNKIIVQIVLIAVLIIAVLLFTVKPWAGERKALPSVQHKVTSTKTATAAGFQSDVSVTAGFDVDGKIANVTVDASGEMAGLGQRVSEDMDFLNQFLGKILPIELGKDVEALSGATVTSTAVVEALNSMAAPEIASLGVNDAATATSTPTPTPQLDLGQLKSDFCMIKYTPGSSDFTRHENDVYFEDLAENEGYYLSVLLTNGSEQDMILELSFSVDGAPIQAFGPAYIVLSGKSRNFHISPALSVGSHQVTWYVNGVEVGRYTGRVLAGSSATPTPGPTPSPAVQRRKNPVITSAEETKGSQVIRYHIYDDGVERVASIARFYASSGIAVIPERLGGLPVVGIEERAYTLPDYSGTLHLPRSLKWIEGAPFNSSLSFSVDEDHPYFALKNGLLIEKETGKAIALDASKRYSHGMYTIPDGVTSIGDNVFKYAYFSSIQIPGSVISIGNSAFSNSLLTAITIPNGVTSIGDDAFSGSRELRSIDIPASVEHIGRNPFGATHRDLLVIVQENSHFEVQNGLLIDKRAGRVIVQLDKGIKKCTIPDGLKSIDAYAFAWSDLSAVQIPESVQEIGEAAFTYCSSLQSVQVPDGVTSIEKDTFSWCRSLKSVRLPESLTSIGDNAFSVCEVLRVIHIPQTVTSIGDSAFSACKKLKSIQIPEGITRIHDLTFFGCESLETIKLPESLTTIGILAFSSCSALKSVEIPLNVKEIDNLAFEGCSLRTFVVRNSSLFISPWGFKDVEIKQIVAPSGSKAEDYAKREKIPFKKLK